MEKAVFTTFLSIGFFEGLVYDLILVFVQVEKGAGFQGVGMRQQDCGNDTDRQGRHEILQSGITQWWRGWFSFLTFTLPSI